MSATRQAGLLATHRAVQALQVRCIDLGADAQINDPLANILLAAKQGSRLHRQQTSRRAADFLHHADPQIGGRFQIRMLLAAATRMTPAMSNLAEHFQDRSRVRQVIVHQEQRPIVGQAAPGHGGHQLFRQLQGAWPDTHVDQESAGHGQGRMNPGLAQAATSAQPWRWRAAFFRNRRPNRKIPDFFLPTSCRTTAYRHSAFRHFMP
jgi:hypothetical protein